MQRREAATEREPQRRGRFRLRAPRVVHGVQCVESFMRAGPEPFRSGVSPDWPFSRWRVTSASGVPVIVNWQSRCVSRSLPPSRFQFLVEFKELPIERWLWMRALIRKYLLSCVCRRHPVTLTGRFKTEAFSRTSSVRISQVRITMGAVTVVRPRISYADLERSPEDGRRYELYDGEVVTSSVLPNFSFRAHTAFPDR